MVGIMYTQQQNYTVFYYMINIRNVFPKDSHIFPGDIWNMLTLTRRNTTCVYIHLCMHIYIVYIYIYIYSCVHTRHVAQLTEYTEYRFENEKPIHSRYNY